MRFQEIWDKLCEKDPRLLEGTTRVEFKAENLRKLLRQVYGQGEAEGRDSGKAEGIEEQRKRQENGERGNPYSLFDDLFGRR